MLSNALAPVMARQGLHYGWVMVAVTFLVMVATAAAMGNLGVFLVPLQREYGWDTGSISGALALRLLLFGLMAPFAAALIQRYGLRRIVAAALALIVLGLGLSTVMTSVWQLWLYWGLLTGLGTGLTAMVLGATVANRWFVQSRGLVIGILTASSATGQLAFLPLAAMIADNAGWRMAVIPAVLACAVAALLMLLLGRDHPSQLGLPAYGETQVAPPPPPPSSNPFRTAFAVLAEGSRNPSFWVLFFSFYVCGLSTNGLVQTHFIPLCLDFGMQNVEAASVLAMMGAFDFVGTVLSGWLSDRYDSRKLLAWYYGLRGLSLLFLPMSTFSFYGLTLFAVFYGLDWIATVPPTVKLAGQEFGREKAALVFGWVFTGHQLGAATAALGAGISRDAFASYLPAFYTAGAACMLAAIAVLMIRQDRQPGKAALAGA
ncbi:MFS transporter [Enterovirga aerilata]|uniref:MFS transporter n=1 Tax=Enterovirga aerilata TaxID=2730920 RepID=A0A849I6A1_9HYPH|nr:MFS transporter [Enterovirga sp. DB1703]NNM71567.1 MFS transporter [Enterovirga sp. DB1703]